MKKEIKVLQLDLYEVFHRVVNLLSLKSLQSFCSNKLALNGTKTEPQEKVRRSMGLIKSNEYGLQMELNINSFIRRKDLLLK